MHLAVFHDHSEAMRADQHRLVDQGIAVDQKDVGERARRRAPFVAHQFAADRSSAAQSFVLNDEPARYPFAVGTLNTCFVSR
jgi:hypothetical protein